MGDACRCRVVAKLVVTGCEEGEEKDECEEDHYEGDVGAEGACLGRGLSVAGWDCFCDKGRKGIEWVHTAEEAETDDGHYDIVVALTGIVGLR